MVYKNLNANDVLSKVSIVDVIKTYLPVTKKGREYLAICPFHDDSKPSLNISEEKRVFHCFSCQAKGNAIQFVQRKEGISFYDAILKVAQIGGIDLSEYQNNIIDKYSKEKKCLADLNEMYQFLLDSNEDALNYCENRGLNQELRNYFKIGYSPKNSDKTIEALRNIKSETGEKIHSIKTMQDLNICVLSAGVYKDPLEDRIIFPITNSSGEIVAFSGRYFRENRPDECPKYRNSNESVVFHKSDVLYNYSNAKQYAFEEKSIYIVEGFMDAIALYKIGIKSCVALMGTNLSQHHIDLLKKLDVEIRVCLDNDAAGQSNNLEIIKKLNQFNVNYKIAKKSNLAKDADEILSKYGPDTLREVVSNLISQQEFFFDFYSTKHDISKEPREFIHDIFKEIKDIKDEFILEDYFRKMSSITSYSIETISNAYKKFINLKFKKENSSIKTNVNKVEPKNTYVNQFDDNIEEIVYYEEENTIDDTYDVIEEVDSKPAQTKEKVDHNLHRIKIIEENIIKWALYNTDKLDVLSQINFLNQNYSKIYYLLKEYLNSSENLFKFTDFMDFIRNKSKNNDEIISQISNLFIIDKIEDFKINIDNLIKELNIRENLFVNYRKISQENNIDRKAEFMELQKKLNLELRNINKK